MIEESDVSIESRETFSVDRKNSLNIPLNAIVHLNHWEAPSELELVEFFKANSISSSLFAYLIEKIIYQDEEILPELRNSLFWYGWGTPI
ncbi:MAG: hypothetical protein AB7O48_05800 [Cyclobacteriaceae bacterium]